MTFRWRFEAVSEQADPVSYLAAFGFFELADVYMYRLREKGIISDELRIVRLPNSEDSGALAQLAKRVNTRVEVCGCRSEDSYRAAYNVIEVGYDTKHVGWKVLEGVKSSEDLLREEQEAEAAKIQDFYAQKGDWLHVSTREEAAAALGVVEKTRGRIELCWMDEEARHNRIGHSASKIDAINSRRVVSMAGPPEYGYMLGWEVVPKEDALGALLAACSERGVLMQENKHPY